MYIYDGAPGAPIASVNIWVHYAARHDNPITGTWTQQDTLDTPLDPTNANRYAYASGDPINTVDPTGRALAACIGAGFSFVGGALSLIGSGISLLQHRQVASPESARGLDSLAQARVLSEQVSPWLTPVTSEGR